MLYHAYMPPVTFEVMHERAPGEEWWLSCVLTPVLQIDEGLSSLQTSPELLLFHPSPSICI